MNVLILGATGFIGTAIAARLVEEGHDVTGLGRDPARASRKRPDMRWARADLAKMQRAEDWTAILSGQDAVVNCAGALQDGLADDLAATQADAMRALYAAAAADTSPLIVQISADTGGPAADLPFLATKRAADTALAASGLPYVILRPALVLGRNAHGGSALLRALAALPLATPVIHGQSPVAVTALDDLAAIVGHALAGRIPAGTDRPVAAPQTLTLAALIVLHRQWLGLKPVPAVPVPAAFAMPVTWAADLAGRLGWRSPLRATAMAVMAHGIAAETGTDGTMPMAMQSAADILGRAPSGVQDLWFARLYLLKPLVIGVLALFWMLSGVIPLFDIAAAAGHFRPFLPTGAALAVTGLTCAVDMALGMSVLVRPFARKALYGMVAVTLAYLAAASLAEPALWRDPLGPLVKVMPSLVLTFIALAILDER